MQKLPASGLKGANPMGEIFWALVLTGIKSAGACLFLIKIF